MKPPRIPAPTPSRVPESIAPRLPARLPRAIAGGWVRAAAVGAVAALGLNAGCNREDPVRAYQAPKDPPTAFMAAARPRPAAAGANPIEWAVPAGWREATGDPMRFATFRPAADPALDVSVMALPGEQSLGDNVRRWEGQLGLAPTPEGELEPKLTTLQTAGGPARVIDLVGKAGGEDRRMLGAALYHPNHTWFFKLTGPPGAVGGQKDAFEAFLKSVHFPAGAPAGPESADEGEGPARGTPPDSPTAHADRGGAGGGGGSGGGESDGGGGTPADAGATAGRLEGWSTPAGWIQDKPTSNRVVSFQAGEGNEGAAVIVSKWPAVVFASRRLNLDRWRGEAGLPPLAGDAEAAGIKPQDVRVGDRPGMLYDFAGPAAGSPAKRVRVAVVPTGDLIWFFKLTGDAKAVDGQRANFEAFLQSVRFGRE